MMSRLSVIAIALFLAACATRPIENVENRPIPDPAQSLSLAEIGSVIDDAATSRGWWVDKKADGHIVAKILKPNSYEASVDVKYSNTSYSIVYNTSSGLIDPQGNIHHRYGRWVKYLDMEIQQRLALEAQRKRR